MPLRPVSVSRRAVAAAPLVTALACANRRFALPVRAEDAPVADGWVAFRTYALKPDADRAALIARTGEAFIPLLQGLDGFIGYFVIEPAPLEWTSITVWRDEAASAAALPPIREWVEANVASSIASGPEGFEGAVDIAAFDDSLAAPAQGTPAPAPEAGWVAVRTYRLKPDTDRAALIADSERDFVPLLRELDGFVAWYILQPDPLTWTAVTVWRDRAASDAGLTPIRDWVTANVADRLEGAPESMEGAVDVAAFDA